jgi:methylglutamate dehydrogenase subunit D
MVELLRRSPLEMAAPYKSERLRIVEKQEFTLMQLAGFGKGFEESLADVAGKLPAKVGFAATYAERIVMRVGPHHFWIVGPENDQLDFPTHCLVTSLTSSRCRMALEGAPARNVLAHCAPLDFHEKVFRPGMFAQTGIHHTPVLIHCVTDDIFHVYALRTFARSVWDWVTDAAAHGDN